MRCTNRRKAVRPFSLSALLCSLILLSFVLLAAGCAPTNLPALRNNLDEFPQEKTTIVFWNENAAKDRTNYYHELIEKFEEQNPDIHVEYVGLPKKAARLKLNTAIATGETPDVSGMQSAWIAEFCNQGVLMDLDPWFQQSGVKADILPAVIEANRSLAPDGGLYQLPNTMSAETLWYRADWFQQAGLGVPRTWDDFFRAAAVLNHPDQEQYGFTIRGGDGAGLQLMRAMFAYSGYTDFFDADGKCRIDDPVHIAFVKQYLGLYRRNTPMGDITNGYQEMVESFDNGTAAMMQHNIGSYGSQVRAMQPEQFAMAMLPRSRSGTIVQEANNVDGYSVFKGTKHPDAAWRFVQFLCSAETQSWWNERIGQMPVSRKALDETWVSERQHLQVVRDAVESPEFHLYEPPMYLPDYRKIVDGADSRIEQVMLGNLTVEEFLHGWADAFNQAENTYRAEHGGK